MGFKIKIKKPRITIKKPKITIKAPSVTIAAPKVTVGGGIGKAGQVVIRGATRAIEDFSEAPLNIASDIGQVFAGKPMDEAFKAALLDYIKPVASGVDLAAIVSGQLDSLSQKLVASTGVEAADALLADLKRYFSPITLEHASALVASVANFIETGSIDALNPITILIAAEIGHARNTLKGLASPIPQDVIAALPEQLRGRAGVCRAMRSADVPGDLNLPAIAIRHLAKASAVCLVDVIVFDRIPSATGDEDLFYWSHELHHAQQYAGWGLEEFVRRYVRDELAKKDPLPIEEDADLYACNFFPQARPRYLKNGCPV